MRKLFASLMVVVMLVMCVQPCFATGDDDYFTKARMNLSVSACKSGTADYQSPLDLEEILSPTKVDYKIVLNMEDVVRALELAEDRSDVQKVRNGKLRMNLVVTAKYPAAAIIDEQYLGSVNRDTVYNGIFKETNRDVDNSLKEIKSTFELNSSDLTLQNLIDSKAIYLNNISFDIENGVTYSTNGPHIAEVSALGYVYLTFTDGHEEKVLLKTETPVTHKTDVLIGNHCRFEMEDTKAATCTEDGTGVGIKCTYHTNDPYHESQSLYPDDFYAIGAMKPSVLPKLNHIKDGVNGLTKVNGVTATCTKTGEYEHYNCKYCKKDYKDANGSEPMANIVIAALGHNKVTVGRVEPIGCTTNGHEAGIRCDRCGTVFEGMTVIPAKHTKRVTTPAKAADCTVDGCTEGADCSVCGAILSISKPISSLGGHKFSAWTQVEGTENMTRECLVCGEPETKTVHTCAVDESKTRTVAATCISKGSVTTYCSCDSVISVTITEKAPHTLGNLIPGVDATCSSEGKLPYYECTVPECKLKFRDAEGKSVLSSITIPKNSNNHKDPDTGNSTLTVHPDGGREIYAATCLKSGLKEIETCSKCGYVKNEILSQYVHKASDAELAPNAAHKLERVELAASCETTGVVAHLHCPKTGKDFSTENNAKGVLDDWTGKDFVIPANGHTWGSINTSTTPATMTCTTCQKLKQLTTGECPGHQYQRTIITNATCTANGSAKDVCLLCGHTVNVILPKGHTYVEATNQDPGDWIDEVPSTCTVKGTKGHYHCLRCNGYFDINNRPIDEINYDLESHDIDTTTGICKNNCGYKIVVNKNASTITAVDKVEDTKPNYTEEQIKEGLEERETDFRNVVGDIGVSINYTFEDRLEVSDDMDESIQQVVQSNNIDEIEGVGKVPFEVTVERVIEYIDNTHTHKKDVTEIKETEDLIEITVDISSIKDMVKYVVHRIHDGIVEYVEETPHYITHEQITEIDRTNWKLKMKVKRFSEYTVVGYKEDIGQLNPSAPPSLGNSGGGGSSTFTVRFHANGGTVVESVKVKKGEIVTEPVTTRDGYKFEGWYTDSAFTKLYDFSTPVKVSLNLYAKWSEDGSAISDTICNKFVDIDIDEWYHEGVHYAIKNGIMNGTGAATFDPAINVSRAMLVTVLWRAENKPAATEECAFVDLESGQYYVEAVKWANENGVVTGTTETTFAPDNAITREQFAAIMYRYAGLKGYDVSVGENTNILSYTDFNKISEYAIPAMQYAVGSGLMKGKSASTLNPVDNATRAEMATILYRFFEANK